MSHAPREELAQENPWYTEDQFACASHVSQYRPITMRRDFILTQVLRYRKSVSDETIRVLDAGCGDGLNLESLSRVEGAQLWGIEYNPLRAQRAQRRFPQASILVADLTRQLPFIDGYFDVILLSQVIEHIRDDAQVLKSLARVLSSQGILILGTPNEGCAMARLRNNVFEPYIARTTDHVNFYTETRIRRLIEDCGFRITDVLYENFFFPLSKMNSTLASRGWGMDLMTILGRMFRSQVGGYYFVLAKLYRD